MNTETALMQKAEAGIARVDPAAVAAAECEKQRIQAAYIMAMQKPRDRERARLDILAACKRPIFADKVEYSKPVGGGSVVGVTIRFIEEALSLWGNIMSNTSVVYEDEHIRRVKATVVDLETNSQFSQEVSITKTVERRNAKGRKVVGERVNTFGDAVYIVVATDEEMANKENSALSRVIRNQGRRLLPSDIEEEAVATARATLSTRGAKDPAQAKKNMIDAFATIGVYPSDLESYLGNRLDGMLPAQVDELRSIYNAIKDGEAKWSSYAADEPEPDPSGDLKAMKAEAEKKAAAKKKREAAKAKKEKEQAAEALRMAEEEAKSARQAAQQDSSLPTPGVGPEETAPGAGDAPTVTEVLDALACDRGTLAAYMMANAERHEQPPVRSLVDLTPAFRAHVVKEAAAFKTAISTWMDVRDNA